MDSDDAAKITALVAAQLAEHAAREKQARDDLYSVVGGIARGMEQLAKDVKTVVTKGDDRAYKLVEAFGSQFVARMVPLLTSRAATEAAEKFAPLEARIDAIEQRQNGGH